LSREELSARLEPFLRSRGLTGGPEDVPLGHYLQVTPPREIIARMLRNLKEIHKHQADWQRLVAVQDRLLILLPQAWEELRDRGLAYAELGQARLALQDLETYLAQVSESQDRRGVLDQIAGLRRALG
jgi:regulator of sirC expression with transglutaminase-like and TPR domain